MFPFLFEDKILYFASNGHSGLGGLDLFRIDLTDPDATVENLGYPMNTEHDDFGLIRREDQGFFSSDRAGGVGSDDIYQFQIFEFDIEPKLVDGRSLDPLDGEIQIMDLVANRLVASVSNEHSVTFTGLRGREYAILGNTDGYLSNTVNFSPTELPEGDAAFVVPVPLYRAKKFNALIVINNNKEDQVWYGEEELNEYGGTFDELENNVTQDYGEIVAVDTIENILYDYDRWNIREDAAENLNHIVEILKDHEDLNIALSSHTDQRGTNRYNEVLANKRVQSAKAYLEEKGISTDRIRIESFGETRLLEKCDAEDEQCNERLHQSNRRTEIKLISTKKKMAMR